MHKQSTIGLVSLEEMANDSTVWSVHSPLVSVSTTFPFQLMQPWKRWCILVQLEHNFMSFLTSSRMGDTFELHSVLFSVQTTTWLSFLPTHCMRVLSTRLSEGFVNFWYDPSLILRTDVLKSTLLVDFDRRFIIQGFNSNGLEQGT